MKICRKCGESKPLDEFYRMAGMRDGHRNECKRCSLNANAARHRANPEPARERTRQWARDNPERVAAREVAYRESGRKAVSNRRSHLKRKYGITPEEYDELLAEQGGGCGICGRLPRDDISLHVDHDHATGAIRGLLCFRCNNALGDFEDDYERLTAAVRYLRPAAMDEAIDELVRARQTDLVASAGAGTN